jgi:hypothetical protein
MTGAVRWRVLTHLRSGHSTSIPLAKAADTQNMGMSHEIVKLSEKKL